MYVCVTVRVPAFVELRNHRREMFVFMNSVKHSPHCQELSLHIITESVQFKQVCRICGRRNIRRNSDDFQRMHTCAVCSLQVFEVFHHEKVKSLGGVLLLAL